MGPTIVAAARTLRTDLSYRITIRLGRLPQELVALSPEFRCTSISQGPALIYRPKGRPTLADYVAIPGVYAAGRLDLDSEGLLLLTLDGRLAHHRPAA